MYDMPSWRIDWIDLSVGTSVFSLHSVAAGGGPLRFTLVSLRRLHHHWWRDGR